mmetsp:Transcript_163093/g.313273  ORF Transcript_163093/g.313273 Transcript_163093/m.313273 type:complete len:794 (-) Transcript_163093:4-2385(-)
MRVKPIGIFIFACSVAFVTYHFQPSSSAMSSRWSPVEVASFLAISAAVTTETKTTSSTTTTTITIDPSKLFHGIIRSKPVRHKYAESDAFWFANWSRRVHREGKGLPRVLIYTWCTESTYYRYINEVYWKTCYAHAHGFDIVFTSEKNFPNARGWNWPMFVHLGYGVEEINAFAWVKGVHDYIDSGEWDYVFMMSLDTLIQEHQFDFPVWAWDRGHDITLMDQYHFVWPDSHGLNVNGILFKNTDYTKQFLADVFEYRHGFYLLNDQGPFMVTMLIHLGREAKEKGKMPYLHACTNWMRLHEPYDNILNKEYQKYAKIAEHFSHCFFRELDRMVGTYGFRFSAHFGFSTTFNLQPSGNRILPEYYEKPSQLGPWSNCWRNVRKWWPHPEKNCFAYRWNGPHMVLIPTEKAMYDFVQGQCPEPTFDWWWSPFNNRMRGQYLQKEPSTPIIVRNPIPWYFAGDWIRFVEWAPLLNFPNNQKLPRVLIYTWVQEEWLAKYVNEVHWKACYAHMHGYEIIFSQMNISLLNGFDQWYAQENMWAWWPDLQQFLFSGDYDYVLMMGMNSLISETFLDFPVWAWDTGHDITLMDESHFASPNPSGLNINNILFKSSEAARQFGDQVYEFRKGFKLSEGDNGPFMEIILQTLGAEDKAAGNRGYEGKCLKYLKEPIRKWSDGMKWAHLNDKYNICFFDELDRLVGTFGKRLSRKIGFSPTFVTQDEQTILPAFVHGKPGILGPWANCWSSPRKMWSDPESNCFANRWNESEVLGQVLGVCPDDSFHWDTYPFNPVNRGFGR